MTATAPLLVIHPLFGDQQNGSHGHQPAADYIEKGSADAAGGGQLRSGFVQNLNDCICCRCISAIVLIPIAIQQIIANSRRNGTSLHSPAE